MTSKRFANAIGILSFTVAVLAAAPALAQVQVSDYHFAPSINDRYIGNFTTEIWARIYRPPFVGTTRYPLIVMLHGKHATCGTGSNPRRDDKNIDEATGDCPPGYSVVKSHEGYAYLANDLAARGYIVVSINANRGFVDDVLAGDAGKMRARGRLVLWHLKRLADWNSGAFATPSSVGVSLKDRIDFNQVGLMGHSRGAVGMRSAIADYRNSPAGGWHALIPNLKVRALLEVAPASQPAEEVPIEDAREVAFLHLVGLCDGELSSATGQENVASPHFDRLLQNGTESGSFFKAEYGIAGGNHRYFNTEWQQNDSPRGCLNQTALFTGAPDEVGSVAQRDAALPAVRNFFLATVGTGKDPSLARAFDPVVAAPDGPPIWRSFSASPTYLNSLRLETFDGPTGTNASGVANAWNGLTAYFHSHVLNEHDPDYPYGTITWSNGASSNKYFQANWASAGSGWNLSPYQYLELRVLQALDGPPPEFSIRLVKPDGTLSSPVSSASYITLAPYPITLKEDGVQPGNQMPIIVGYQHPVLRTVRIPLTVFGSVNLASVRGARFVFDRTAQGSIILGSVVAATDMNLARGKLITVSSVQDNNGNFAGSKANDVNTGTRWSSAFSDAQWIYVDLGASTSFKTVVLRWEAAYGRDFRIQVSNNASAWTDIKSVTGGTGGTQILNVGGANARYVRMLGVARGTQWGYSLYEFEVYAN